VDDKETGRGRPTRVEAPEGEAPTVEESRVTVPPTKGPPRRPSPPSPPSPPSTAGAAYPRRSLPVRPPVLRIAAPARPLRYGEEVDAELTVANGSDLVARYALSATGPHADWVEFAESDVAVYPSDHQVVRVRVRPDVRAFPLAGGEVIIPLRAVETSEPDVAAAVELRIVVPPRFSVGARAVPDLPARSDSLGVEPLVQGLAALLDDPRTELPLTVSVAAPWGAGKSSLMLQLREELRRPAPPAGGGRVWSTVSFDAWKYAHSEQLWAALVRAIYEQSLAVRSAPGRVLFRLRLELRRHGWPLFLARALLPVLGIAVVLAAAATVLGPGAPAVGSSAVLLASLGTLAGRYWGVLGDPFRRAINRYAEPRWYETRLGFGAEAEHQVECLTDVVLREPGHALAVFVDDLDRLAPNRVIDLVEAVNQVFNSSPGRRCVFVLGMDRDVIAASIDVAYGELVHRLSEGRQPLADTFGLDFLEKIVQLTVVVPEPRPAAMRSYLLDLLGRAPTAPAGATPAANATTAASVAAIESRLDAAVATNPEDVSQAGEMVLREGGADPAAIEEAERLVRARLLNVDSPHVGEAELALLPYLERNPRQVKRFDCAFRLQLHVANLTRGCTLDFRPEQLVALGKWVVVCLRWPRLAQEALAVPGLLRALEARAHGESSPGDPPGVDRWAAEPEVLRLLAGGSGGQRLADLPFETFLRAV
jgi:hypothetical protein